jgi:hypothetical protein
MIAERHASVTLVPDRHASVTVDARYASTV